MEIEFHGVEYFHQVECTEVSDGLNIWAAPFTQRKSASCCYRNEQSQGKDFSRDILIDFFS